jgi:hypothetical protein
MRGAKSWRKAKIGGGKKHAQIPAELQRQEESSIPNALNIFEQAQRCQTTGRCFRLTVPHAIVTLTPA